MNSQIKRLLKLSNIPGFKLSSEENKILEDWKKQQKPVVPIPPKSAPKKKYTRRKKTTNEVKNKEMGELEIEA